MSMSVTSSKGLLVATQVLIGVLVGYCITLLGSIFALTSLFILAIVLHTFRVLTVNEVLLASVEIMKRIFSGAKDAGWLGRVPWTALLAGGILRLGHDYILISGGK